jgi:uncharacterized protein YraI
VKKIRRTLGIAAIIAGAATVAMPVGAASAATTGHHSPASPNTYGEFYNHVWYNGVTMRSGPGTGYSAVIVVYPSWTLLDYCYTTGTTIYGNQYWDYVQDAATGLAGYVTEYYLNDKSQTQHC